MTLNIASTLGKTSRHVNDTGGNITNGIERKNSPPRTRDIAVTVNELFAKINRQDIHPNIKRRAAQILLRTRRYITPRILIDRYYVCLIWGDEWDEPAYNVKIQIYDTPYWDRMAVDDGNFEEIASIGSLHLALHSRRKYLGLTSR